MKLEITALFVTVYVLCVQITSPDVAESLGLSVGRYEYVERQQETLANSTATETSPAASTAGSSSHSVPSEVETASTVLPDSGLEAKDRTEAMLGDASNTAWNEVINDDADKSVPCDRMRDHLESKVGSDCGDCTAVDAQIDVVGSDKNERADSLGNKDSPLINGDSHRMEHPETNSYIGSNFSGSTVVNGSPNQQRCLMKTADSLIADSTCSDTDRLAVRSEMPEVDMSISDDAVCQLSIDSGEACHSDGANLVFETTTRCHMQSSEQQNSSSDTVTLLPTAEDLEGLLKVISRT